MKLITTLMMITFFVWMGNLQPDLNGNPFLRVQKFYLIGNRLQKRLGVEGG